MSLRDIRTAIEGKQWIIHSCRNRARIIETIFELDDLYQQISKDSSKAPLLKTIKHAIRREQWTCHVVGASCCRRCRYTEFQNCRCFLTKTGAFKS